MSVKFDFSGKLVLVTGSTLGIGRAIAEEFIKSGANVIINSRSSKSVNNAVNQLRRKYIKSGSQQKIYGIPCDLTKSKECNALISKVNNIGHLNILINNAGMFFTKPFENVSDNEWQHIFNTNVMSTVRLSRGFLPNMLKCKNGVIINISSEAGVRSLPVMIHYSMTKAAQINVGRGLAELTKGIPNVRVNTILPGPTMTDGVKEYLKGFAKDKGYKSVNEASTKYFQEFEPTSLKQNFLDPNEIAKVCLFLCSNDASGINGSAIKVEGGIIRSMI